MELLSRISYLRNIYLAKGGDPERMLHVKSSNLECLERLVFLREGMVREHLIDLAGLSGTKYYDCSIELLAQKVKAKQGRQC